jgi:methionine-rich copper-binding protein CopC
MRFNKLVVAGLGVLAGAATLVAHAVLVSAYPAPNAVLDSGAFEVKLQFNSRIDVKRSRLVLAAPERAEQPLAIRQSTPDVLLANVIKLPSGAYLLRWQVLAEDGHISRGSVPFKVR